jgi:NodT family efflux transporter outer membrane factor (OMF) lipoprotein
VKKFVFFIAAGLTLALNACAPLGPRYRRPKAETPPAYKEQGAAAANLFKPAAPSDAAARGPWWTLFNDPVLNTLESKVTVSNQNVKQSEAAFRDARALVTEIRAGYFPTVTANPSVTRSFGPNAGVRSTSSGGTNNTFILPVEASWELNLWGRVTLAVRNAYAAMQASAADLENMRLSMQAELASDYFTLRADDIQVALLNSSITSYEKALQLTLARQGGGVASQADVAQARTQLDSTRAQATDLALIRAQLEHAIAVLVGQSPSSFALSTGTIQALPPAVPAGIPSEILQRRPDIASAERLVAAANANIGLARVAYFPTISLTAAGGFQSGTFVDWLSWPNRFWSLGTSATETLLSFGARRGQRLRAEAQYDEAVAVYRQTVLSAFQDVEDNLAAQQSLAQETLQQESAAQSAEKSLALENALYQAGTVSYLDVITTQNIALTNERALAQVTGRRMTAAVSLLRALGGGWDVAQLPSGAGLEKR